jgi:hypothetical protein
MLLCSVLHFTYCNAECRYTECVMLNVVMLSVTMPSAIMPSVIMPTVIMLSVIMLSIMAPRKLIKTWVSIQQASYNHYLGSGALAIRSLI